MRTVGIRLTAEVGQYVANMRRAQQSTKGFAEGLDQQAKAGKLDAIADRAGMMGIAVGAGVGLAVKSFMDFDKAMSGVKAATHASAGEMEQLRSAAMKAGADTQFSATEAAKGVTELAKAGISTTDILAGGLNGALSLAAAGEMDVGAAAETAASALTQFKLKGKDVPHVADLLAAAAGKAQGEVSDMAAALNQAGLIAAQTGLSIEDTTGTLAAFANAGLLGSDAGTSFKTMLQAVQAPSGKTKELMDDLGISAYDTAGNFIGITKFAGQLKSQLGKLTPELRANALAQIFGSDATRAASILYEQGAEGITKWIDKTNDAGFAAETAAIKTDNLAGDIERLKGSVDTFLIQAGGGANGGLRIIAQSLEKLVDQFARLPGGVTASITVIGALTAVVLLGLAAWVKARSAIAAAVVELNAVGPAGARAAVGLQKATKAAGIAGAAFIALEIAGAVFDSLGNDAINVSKLTASLEDFANTGKLTEGMTDSFGKDLEYLGKNAWLAEQGTHGLAKGLNDIAGALPGVSPMADTFSEWLTGTSINDSTDRMKALDESLTAFIATQKDAKKAGEIWNRIVLESGLSYEQVQKLLPGASAALTELQKTSHAAAGTQEKLAEQTGKTTEELKEEEEAAKNLQKAFDELFDRYMSADEAAIKYEKALASTNKELKSGSKSLEVNTEAGQKNRGAILDLIDAIKDQREANINGGMAVDEADRLYRKQIGTLKTNAVNLGFNATKVGALIDKYHAIPGKVGTTIEQPGMVAADKRVKEYDKKLDDLDRKIKTEISVNGDGPANAKLQELLIKQRALQNGLSIGAAKAALQKDQDRNRQRSYHDGGWTGPGDKYDVAGTVHADEYVIPKQSRRRIEAAHPGLLDEMRSTGQVPGYADGGRVTRWPFPVDASKTKIISLEEALSKVTPKFGAGGSWPSSPSAVRGDSGRWRKIKAWLDAANLGGSFGNGYRPGDPKWHGSGWAVDWMGFNLDSLASRLAAMKPLELIHRTKKRDYAYTRGVNKGSFNNALMNAHKNHVHIAMANGGVIGEPVVGVGASGKSYSFGENGPETVTPGNLSTVNRGVTIVKNYNLTFDVSPLAHPREVGRRVVEVIQAYESGSGTSWRAA